MTNWIMIMQRKKYDKLGAVSSEHYRILIPKLTDTRINLHSSVQFEN